MSGKALSVVVLLLAAGTAAEAATATVTINRIDANGVGKAIGTLLLEDTEQGLKVTPRLTGLPWGPHGFHVHANASCAPGEQNGQKVAGLGAGGHLDPAATGKHLGPAGDGHKGDMPRLIANGDGTANTPAFAPHLTVADARATPSSSMPTATTTPTSRRRSTAAGRASPAEW
jgi:Cu-Zn family superoxide dismutase